MRLCSPSQEEFPVLLLLLLMTMPMMVYDEVPLIDDPL